MKRFRLYLSLDRMTKFLFIEAFIILGLARILKSLPFSKYAPYLGSRMEETAHIHKNSELKIIMQVAQSINVLSRNTFWESKCLVQAITGMIMLNRRGIDSTIYLGTGKDEKGSLIAHAWLRSGDFYVTGAEGMEKFTVVGSFAKHRKIDRGEQDE